MCAEERCAMREGFTKYGILPNETTDFSTNAVPIRCGSDAGPAEAEACRSRSNPQIRRAREWSCVLECAGMSVRDGREVKAAVRQAPVISVHVKDSRRDTSR